MGKGKATEGRFNLQSPSHDVSRRPGTYRSGSEEAVGKDRRCKEEIEVGDTSSVPCRSLVEFRVPARFFNPALLDAPVPFVICRIDSIRCKN